MENESNIMSIDHTEIEVHGLAENENDGKGEEYARLNDQVIEEPKLHMVFDNIDEVYEYYRKYGAQQGFGVTKRSTKKSEGVVKYFTVVCHKYGESKKSSNLTLKPHPIIKTGCAAKVCAKLLEDGKWGITALELEHNHGLSPSKSRFHRCNRYVTPYIKRRLELNNDAGIPMNKSFNSIRVEYGENVMPCLKKDCENYMGKLKKLRLAEGDASALQTYFAKVQSVDSNFFCLIDPDKKNRIKNIFWADSRSRAASEEFGDVIMFDTTYLTNKYDMPFAPFVGVNHHGQSILLGCGLISNEDTETFVWLFDAWLSSMYRKAPHAIITDQDQAMRNAIEIVFPNARHRWCLWHIMKKIPEKLKGYEKYESIKFSLYNVVYDSLSAANFENDWKEMIEDYELESNDWLRGLFEERHRWVPCFVKDCFWAGMSTTQRSEGMNAFFDGFVNAKTSLKEFVDQYDNALRSKVEKEIEADSHSLTSIIPCVTHHAIEKQFQEVYTNAKFREFQKEVVDGGMYCDSKFVESHDKVFYYEVRQLCYFGEKKDRQKFVNFNVCFTEGEDEDEFDVRCDCKLFEFRGIVCRHIVKVLHFERSIFTVPKKYILRRWRKDIKRRHTKAKVTYNIWKDTESGRRYDKMCNIFFDVADRAYDTQERCDQLANQLLKLKVEWDANDGVCEKVQPTQKVNMNDPTYDSQRLLSPEKNRCKGRPPKKRKVGKVEQVSNKLKRRAQKKSKNTSRSINTWNENEAIDHNAITHQSSVIYETQESRHENIDLNDSIWGDEFLNPDMRENSKSAAEGTSNVG